MAGAEKLWVAGQISADRSALAVENFVSSVTGDKVRQRSGPRSIHRCEFLWPKLTSALTGNDPVVLLWHETLLVDAVLKSAKL